MSVVTVKPITGATAEQKAERIIAPDHGEGGGHKTTELRAPLIRPIPSAGRQGWERETEPHPGPPGE